MTLDLPADPSLRDLQLPWEAKYWGRPSWPRAARALETARIYFRDERKPRDIFRFEVAEFKDWLRKQGKSEAHIGNIVYSLTQFYQFLDELELVEKDFNPFREMAPKRIRIR